MKTFSQMEKSEMKRIAKMNMNKKGQLNLGLVTGVFVALLTIFLIAIVVYAASGTVRDAGLFTTNSLEDNATRSATANISAGVGKFFGSIPTIMGVVVLVVVIGALLLLLVLVNRNRVGGTSV